VFIYAFAWFRVVGTTPDLEKEQKSCGGIKFDIVTEYGEKMSTDKVDKVITTDKLSQTYLSQDKLSQVHLNQDKDNNAIISNEPVIDALKFLQSFITIPKGLGPVIDTIDTTDITKCIQSPKCVCIQPPQLPKYIQQQVGCCKWSNNSNDEQEVGTNTT